MTSLQQSQQTSNPTREITTQIDFAVTKLREYLYKKKVDNVGVRRLHYYIVSLPVKDRQIPSTQKNKTRAYSNTKNDYQNLSRLLVKARINGLIPLNSIIDEKNKHPYYMPARKNCETRLYYELPVLPDIPDLVIPRLPELEDLGINILPYTRKPVFNNQSHRIVVVIEKATSREMLERLCTKYGADLLIFSGQYSLTRVIDVAQCAKHEDKPIHLLYISDLDCGGWVMPPAFFDRLQSIYPHSEHKMERIALTRDQVLYYNLPTAFDSSSKQYSAKQVEKFIKESNGRACIELDALDETILLDLLETKLKTIAGLDKDKQEYDYISKNTAPIISDFMNRWDLSEKMDEYESIRNEYNNLIDDLDIALTPYRDSIERINELCNGFLTGIEKDLRMHGLGTYEETSD